MTVARGEVVDDQNIGIYHCWVRCVRRAFLCGQDPYTGQDFEHRKDWVRERLQLLAGVFGIEILTYAVMSNHVHLVVRNRPDLAAAWSDDEVAERWTMVYPSGTGIAAAKPANTMEGVVGADAMASGTVPGDAAAVRAVADGASAERASQGDGQVDEQAVPGDVGARNPRIEELRRRLCSISWLMKALNEFIARRANREDRCRGRFWESRFKCQHLLDEAAVLACMAYVDLNPVRACVAESLADPQFTGAFDRIQSRQARQRLAGLGQHGKVAGKASESRTRAQQCLENREAARVHAADWLAPLGGADSPLPGISERSYLDLLDWTGRQIRSDKPGHIPDALAPLLMQINIDTEQWLTTVEHYGSLFYRLVGHVERMVEYAASVGRRFCHGLTAARQAFSATPQPT